MIKKIVDYMIQEGTQCTTSGNWHFSFDEIADTFEVTPQWIEEHADDFEDEIYSHEEIADEGCWFDYDDDTDPDRKTGFDLLFWLGYCPYAEEDEEEEW